MIPTITQEMLECIEKHLPAIHKAEDCRYDAIKKTLTFEDCRFAAFHLETKKYFTLHCMFGHAFMIGLLRHYESIEQYEICLEIVSSINQMNNLVNTNFSTKEYEKIK